MINEVEKDYLAGCKPVKVAPSYATINEYSFYMIEATEREFNNIMMNVGVSELHHLELNGSEIIYEAGSDRVAKLKESFSNWIKQAWEKIQGLWNEAMKKIKEKIADAKDKIFSKLGDKLAEKAKYIPDDMEFGVSYTYKNLDGNYHDNMKSAIDAAINSIDAGATAGVAKIKAGNPSNEVCTEYNKKFQDKLDKIMNALYGPDNNSRSQNADDIKAFLRGEEVKMTKAWVLTNLSNINNELKSGSSSMKAINKAYKDDRAIVNKMMKDSEKAAKNAEAFDAALYANQHSQYKQLISLIMKCDNAIVGCMLERYKAYTSVALKLVGKIKTPKEEKKPVGEATTFDMVDSLFNW